jgi:hypothetical protein
MEQGFGVYEAGKSFNWTTIEDPPEVTPETTEEQAE